MQISRLSTAPMKINQIPYAIFQATSWFSFKFCITLRCHDTYFVWNFFNWNIICFWQKEPIKAQFFRLLSALMKVHPILHVSFETKRSGFIQILHHCSMSWKIMPLYFFSSNLISFGQKEPIEVKFSNFWVVGWKFAKFLMSYLKPEVRLF